MQRAFIASLAALLAASALAAGSGPIRSDDSNRSLTQLRKEAKADELPAVAEAEPAVADQRFWIVVRASSRGERTKLAEAGLAIEEVRAGTVAGIAHARTIEQLKAKGFVIQSQVSMAKLILDFPPADMAYHNYDRLKAALDKLAQAHPGLVSVFSIGKAWQGRDIWCARLNAAAAGGAPSRKPGALFVGEHHSREHLSVEIPLKIAEYLAEHRGEAAVKRLLDSRDVYVIPMLNPDGAEHDIASGRYRWHRKNMRVNPDQEIGVDLNRNCDFLWGGAGSSGATYSDVYRGPSAFSEPETRALKAFLEARPNIRTFNSYHSYGGLVLYPWGGKDGPVEDAADRKAYEIMAQSMARMGGYRAEQSNEMYVATGDCADWAYAARKVFSFTTELGGSGFYPGPAEIDRQAPGNIKAALYMLEYSDDPRRAVPAS